MMKMMPEVPQMMPEVPQTPQHLYSKLRRTKPNQQKLTRNSDKSVDIIVAVVELWFRDVVDRDRVDLIRVYN